MSDAVATIAPTIALDDQAFKANPYPTYARLRDAAPVQQVRLGRRPAWLVTRYEHVAALLKDDRFAKDPLNARGSGPAGKPPWVPPPLRPLTRNMLDLDAPDHRRLRGLVHQAFTPRIIERMQARIAQLTGQLLDAGRRRGGMDLIADYALPLPTTIIAEILGVPAADQHRFHRWSSAIVSAGSSASLSMLWALPSVVAFLSYIRRLVRLRRAGPRDDLISALVLASEGADALSEDELLAMIFLLLVAGHETTVNLIGNGSLALLQHPDQLEQLRAHPELIQSAVEELARYQSPVEMSTERYAREDLDLHGVAIPRGGLVHGVLASANRDERQFSHPDTLDIARTPNRHLAFGQGAHYCLGAPLARLEAQIAIMALVERSADLRLATDPGRLRWRGGLVLRGLQALPVSLAPLAA